MIGPDGSWGGQGSEPFVARLNAGDEIRIGNRRFHYICQNCDPARVDATFRQGIVRVHTFVGKDAQGRPLRAEIRLHLDSNSGPELK